jgi:hypothetical protein
MTLPAQRAWDASPWLDGQATASGVHAVSGALDMSTAPALRTYLERWSPRRQLRQSWSTSPASPSPNIVGLDPCSKLVHS